LSAAEAEYECVAVKTAEMIATVFFFVKLGNNN
jgi:hypothetical protein